MSHILFLEWNSFGNEYMKRAWRKAGDQFTCFPFPRETSNTRFDEELTKKIVLALMSEKIDYMFSFNYFPVAAIAAKACRIRYVSWVYDSPYAQLYSNTVYYPTNDIRIFDKFEVDYLRTMGVDTVSYLPMAADTEYYKEFSDKAKGEEYKADVSFVGSLYLETNKQIFDKLNSLSDYDKGLVDGIVYAQKQIREQYIIEDLLCTNAELLKNMEVAAPIRIDPYSFETREWKYANYYFYRKVTALERKEIMNLLSEKYDLKVYTHTDDENVKELMTNGEISVQLSKCMHSPVDYYMQAPYVYKNSKINLNITLRSIKNGIPLRAFDIMGCEGFLLTDFQPEFLEYFEPDRDFVYFTDYTDLENKISYYLKHEDERVNIAHNGYEKVKKYHTYDKRIEKIRFRP